MSVKIITKWPQSKQTPTFSISHWDEITVLCTTEKKKKNLRLSVSPFPEGLWKLFFSFSLSFCFSNLDVSLLKKKFLSSTQTSAWLKRHQHFCPVQRWFSIWAHTGLYHLSRGSSDKHLTRGNTSPELFITSHHGAEVSFARGNKAAWIDKENDTKMQARSGFIGRTIPPILLITLDVCGSFLIDRSGNAKAFSSQPGSLACRSPKLWA